MIALPSFGVESAPALRRPVFEISFAAGGGSGGLAGAAVSAVSSATGAGAAADDPWARSVTSVLVETAVAPFVDRADIVLAADSQAPDVAVGDPGGISLGFEDGSPEPVLTGFIEHLAGTMGGPTHVHAANGGAALSRLRVNQGYEQRSAGDIVQDLASRAAVDTGPIESGIDLPFFAADARRNAYQHIHWLARQSGYLAFFDRDGALNFLPPTDSEPVQTFDYGRDIISLRLDDGAYHAQTVTLVGEGAAGSQGADAWSWLVKESAAVTATAGSGERARTVQSPALRSTDAVQAAAQGAATVAAMATSTGRLTVAGAPAVAAASVFAIAGAPDEKLNGTARARRVCHSYSSAQGFVTVVDFWKAGEDGFGGLAGALPGALGGLL